MECNKLENQFSKRHFLFHFCSEQTHQAQQMPAPWWELQLRRRQLKPHVPVPHQAPRLRRARPEGPRKVAIKSTLSQEHVNWSLWCMDHFYESSIPGHTAIQSSGTYRQIKDFRSQIMSQSMTTLLPCGFGFLPWRERRVMGRSSVQW